MDPVDPVAAGPAGPVGQNQVPRRRAPGLQDLGNPPYPGHRFTNPDLLHTFEKMSHKRARGPLCNKSGPPVRVLRQASVMSQDGSNEWHNSPAAGTPDIILPPRCPVDGHPNEEEISGITEMEGFFFALFSEDILEHIVEMTNLEMHNVKTVTGNMSEATQRMPVHNDLTIWSLKLSLGA